MDTLQIASLALIAASAALLFIGAIFGMVAVPTINPKLGLLCIFIPVLVIPSYAPGLHHFCLRVEGENEVKEAAKRLKERNISVSEPKRYPEYAPHYFAVFFSDPDGVRLEITNYRQERRQRHDNWEALES